jgi:hypothetical protein
MKKIVSCLITIWLAAGSLALAMDAEMLKSEKRAVIGQILIQYDESIMSQAVFLVEASTGDRIWIDGLKNLSGDFKNFVQKSAQNGSRVALTGVVEYWTDGVVMLPDNITGYKNAD